MLLVAGLTLLSSAGTATEHHTPRTHTVVPGERALQQSINEAAEGDVLLLMEGIHQGPVQVGKPLTLTGNPGAVIDAAGVGSVITVDGPNVQIEGLHLIGSGSSHETIDSGIRLVEGAQGSIVRNNHLEGNLFGVDVHGARDVWVVDNTIIGRQGHRMNERGNGVYVWNAPGTVIENNVIRFGRDGIFVNNSQQNRFVGNDMQQLRFAIHYMYANNSEVTNNRSVGNHLGYALMFSDSLVIKGNVSEDDRDHGIMLNYANNSLIEGNRVVRSQDKCLFMYNANHNVVRDNHMAHCLIGIHFTAGSQENTISGNAFIGNRTQVKYVGSTHHEWSHGGQGNFWSDHPAFDIDGDGVADQAYRPNDIIDQILWTQPAAALLLGSPAVQLIRWAQSQFPALLPGGVVDSNPLMNPRSPLMNPRDANASAFPAGGVPVKVPVNASPAASRSDTIG